MAIGIVQDCRVAGGPYGTSRPLRTGHACFPGIRLKPFKGVDDDTRSDHGQPQAMDLAMASRMEQCEIVESVRTAFHAPHDMMRVPVAISCN